jgi:hypothetical protein
MTTELAQIQSIQKRHDALWKPVQMVREKLTKRLEKFKAHVSEAEYVVLDTIAVEMIGRTQKISGTKAPEATAVRIGRPDWVPHIAVLLRTMGTKGGGRPRKDDDTKRIWHIYLRYEPHPDWKAIAVEFQKETGRLKEPEACRSAIRRWKARTVSTV